MKNQSPITLLILPVLALLVAACGSIGSTSDLLKMGEDAWQAPDPTRWVFDVSGIKGVTPQLNGAKTSPDASSFLVSRSVFGGDVSVALDLTFEAGRYFGVYLDYDQRSRSGIWMATGHPLADDLDENDDKVEMAYIKTVEAGDWTVRTKGELNVVVGKTLRLRFTRRGSDYSVWHEDRLVVTYRKPGGYPAGQLQLRLTNGRVRIHRLDVESDWVR